MSTTILIADAIVALVFFYVAIGVAIGSFLVMATEQRWRHPLMFTLTAAVLWPLIGYEVVS